MELWEFLAVQVLPKCLHCLLLLMKTHQDMFNCSAPKTPADDGQLLAVLLELFHGGLVPLPLRVREAEGVQLYIPVS